MPAERILIVDDEPTIADTLERHGFALFRGCMANMQNEKIS